MAINAWIIPMTVPKKPSIGAAPAMEPSKARFFSSLYTSICPAFSTACAIVFIGLCSFSIPALMMLAIA